jgi:anti-sigma-K factor RskA
MTTVNDPIAERDEIELLLPWYATDKLDAGDRARVERWLRTDPQLQLQLKVIREERDDVFQAMDAVRMPRTLTVEQAMQAVARGTPAAPLRGLTQALKDVWSGALGAPLRWTAVAAAMALMIQATAIGLLLSSKTDGTYTPASGPSVSAPTQSGTFVLVRFADAATAREIAQALSESEASIVEGPRAGAMYKVRIGPADLSSAARDQRVAALRGRTGLITFVSITP